MFFKSNETNEKTYLKSKCHEFKNKFYSKDTSENHVEII